jgi:hypothetical protein
MLNIDYWAFLLIPYKNIVNESIDANFPIWSEENHWMAMYLKKHAESGDKLKYSIFTFDSRQDQNLIFYFKVLDKNNNLSYKKIEELSVGDTVVVFKKNYHDAVKKAYDVVALDSFAGFVKTYKINGIRKQYSIINSGAGIQ